MLNFTGIILAFRDEPQFGPAFEAICTEQAASILQCLVVELFVLVTEFVAPIATCMALEELGRRLAGSFQGFEPRMGQGWDSDWLYFSFVTMSTLGYGDISPITPIARMLAYMQAVFGLFYIAILVAGLVGTYISNRQSDKSG